MYCGLEDEWPLLPTAGKGQEGEAGMETELQTGTGHTIIARL